MAPGKPEFGSWYPVISLSALLKLNGRQATDDGAFAALGHNKLGTALSAYVAFAGLVSQLHSIIGMLFRTPLGSPQL